MLWFDAPQRGLRLMPRDTFLVPFDLLWGGFAFLWEWMALRTHAPHAMILFGMIGGTAAALRVGSVSGAGLWSPALDPIPQFLQVTEARRVFDRIQELAAASRSGAV